MDFEKHIYLVVLSYFYFSNFHIVRPYKLLSFKPSRFKNRCCAISYYGYVKLNRVRHNNDPIFETGVGQQLNFTIMNYYEIFLA